MNNNIKFDPMTGKPIENSNDNVAPAIPTVEQKPSNQQPQASELTRVENTVEVQPQVSNEQTVQSQLQNIPTVEQTKQDFINNVQSMNKENKEEKKEGINFVFIIILFVVILVAIYFLFPLLLNYI